MLSNPRIRIGLAAVIMVTVAITSESSASASDDCASGENGNSASPALEKTLEKKRRKVIASRDCKKHEGEIVSVRFRVNNVHQCSKGDTYLNESKDYDKSFAAFISASRRESFPSDLNETYRGKTVLVTGLLKTSEGSPKVELTNPDDITIASQGHSWKRY